MIEIDISPDLCQFVRDNLSASANNPRHWQTGLAAGFYTRKDILALERQHLFEQEWICIARVDEVANPGDYVATQVLNEPIILVRDDKGQLQVLANVCRHRCMQVASGSGQGTKGFSCPYHAWRYNLKGELVSAPLMPKKSFDRHLYSLPKIRFEVWQGFVFVTLHDQALPLAPRLSGLEKILTNYHSDEMLHEFVEEDIWHCNWKLLIENFIEAYHLNCVHPQTLRPVTPTFGAEKLAHGEGYTAYAANYDQAYDAAQEFGHQDLTETEANRSSLFCVFPSLLVSQSPHLLVFLAVQPLDTETLRLRWGMSIRSRKMRGKNFADLLALWQQVNAEDRRKLELQQQTYHSRHAQPGPLAPENLEGTIRDFHHYLAKVLGV